MRPALIATLVLALCACGSQADRSRDRGADRGNGSESADRGAAGNDAQATARNSAGTAAVPAEITAQLEQEAASVQSMLPMRNGPVSITAVEAEGNNLVYTVEISNHMDQAEFEERQAGYIRQACASPENRAMLSQGIGFVYQVTDADGHSFETRPSTDCPA